MQLPIGASRQSVQLLRAGGREQPRIRCLTKTVTHEQSKPVSLQIPNAPNVNRGNG